MTTTIWLKKFIEELNSSYGGSSMAVVVTMLLMSLIGAVFASTMGGWLISGARTVNSNRADQLANAAATVALQEASYHFYGGSFNYGTRLSTYTVFNDGNEGTAEYWFELPSINDDFTTGADDDVVDDDGDDGTNTDRYTIVAKGKVSIGGTTTAQRQIKVFADINPNTITPIAPGVHTEGDIEGTGPPTNPHFDMDNPTSGANVTYGNGENQIASGAEAGIVYRNPPVLNSDMFKSIAKKQGHYYSGGCSPGNNYPNNSFYYTGSVPNVTYVEGDLTINGNITVYGVFYVKGSTTVFNGNYQMNGIVICEGDLTMNGGGNKTPNLDGGIIQYGVSSDLTGNGQPVDIDINEDFFDALNGTIPIITNVTWYEAVSAN